MNQTALEQWFRIDNRSCGEIENFTIETLLLLPSLWHVKYLKYFSFIQMKEAQFPWAPIMKEKDLGKTLKERFSVSPNELGQISLPWNQLDAQRRAWLCLIYQMQAWSHGCYKALVSRTINL